MFLNVLNTVVTEIRDILADDNRIHFLDGLTDKCHEF